MPSLFCPKIACKCFLWAQYSIITHRQGLGMNSSGTLHCCHSYCLWLKVPINSQPHQKYQPAFSVEDSLLGGKKIIAVWSLPPDSPLRCKSCRHEGIGVVGCRYSMTNVAIRAHWTAFDSEAFPCTAWSEISRAVSENKAPGVQSNITEGKGGTLALLVFSLCCLYTCICFLRRKWSLNLLDSQS